MAFGLERPRNEAVHLSTLPELTSYLGMFVKAQERAGAPTNVFLVTYNRVGEGKLAVKTTKGHLTLAANVGGASNHLSLEQARVFMERTRDELSRVIPVLKNKTFFVVYGGEGEKFQMALDMITELSSLAQAMGKQELATFYLLTCGCDLGDKVEKARPLYEADQLRYMVYNPAGSCGGLDELQTLADVVLSAATDVDDFGPTRGLVS